MPRIYDALDIRCAKCGNVERTNDIVSINPGETITTDPCKCGSRTWVVVTVYARVVDEDYAETNSAAAGPPDATPVAGAGSNGRRRDGMPDAGTAVAAARCPWAGTDYRLSSCREWRCPPTAGTVIPSLIATPGLSGESVALPLPVPLSDSSAPR